MASHQPVYDATRPLALMHVPKSLGTSLTDALARAIAPRRAVTGFDQAMFGAFQAFHTLDAATRAAIFLAPATLPDADFVAGHFSCSTLRARYSQAQLATVLREPVSRLLSHWLFWRGHDDDQLGAWGAWGDMVRLARRELEAFLADTRVACQTDNQVVRMLLWPHELIPPDRFIDTAHDEALLALAHDRLEDFAFCDVAEGGLPDRLRHWLGRPFVLAHRNETPAVPAHLRGRLEDQFTPTALALLARCSRLDHQLWLATARRTLPNRDPHWLVETTRMINVARFAGLMAPLETRADRRLTPAMLSGPPEWSPQ